MKLTKNFSKKEFDCKDGSEMSEDVFKNVKELANNLQVLRDYLNKSVRLTNAYRSLSHNRKIGSKDTSQHVKGKAADIQINGLAPEKVAYWVKFLIAEGKMKEGGVGIYSTFVHYDIRGTKARWDNR